MMAKRLSAAFQSWTPLVHLQRLFVALATAVIVAVGFKPREDARDGSRRVSRRLKKRWVRGESNCAGRVNRRGHSSLTRRGFCPRGCRGFKATATFQLIANAIKIVYRRSDGVLLPFTQDYLHPPLRSRFSFRETAAFARRISR
jgi:hypothetical protein